MPVLAALARGKNIDKAPSYTPGRHLGAKRLFFLQTHLHAPCSAHNSHLSSSAFPTATLLIPLDCLSYFVMAQVQAGPSNPTKQRRARKQNDPKVKLKKAKKSTEAKQLEDLEQSARNFVSTNYRRGT